MSEDYTTWKDVDLIRYPKPKPQAVTDELIRRTQEGQRRMSKVRGTPTKFRVPYHPAPVKTHLETYIEGVAAGVLTALRTLEKKGAA